MVVCVWVYDGKGNVLLTRRAPQKSAAGSWENSGGAAQAGETSLQAITRELHEETGIVAQPEEFEFLSSSRDKICHYDFYCLHRDIPIQNIKLQPGETDAVKWVSIPQIHQMIENKEICSVIARQFFRQEPQLLARVKAPIV